MKATSGQDDPESSNLYAIAVRPGSGDDRNSSPCPVCSETQGRVNLTVCNERWAVLNCIKCGTGRLDPAPTTHEIASFYPLDYYGREGSKFEGAVELLVRAIAARQARFLCKRLPSGGRILDVGCGRGTLLAAVADQGFEAHGMEISAAAAHGADTRANIVIAPGLIEAKYPAEFFDEIVIWHVLEHLTNPLEVIRECHRLLKPGGHLVVAVPNYSSWQSRWSRENWFHLDLPRHLFHFPINGLKQMVSRCEFKVLSEHHFSLRQNPFGWIQSWQNQLLPVERNSLYCLLQRGERQRVSWSLGLMLRICAAIFLLPAVAMSILEAFTRNGGTVHLVARKPEAAPSHREST